MGIRRWSVDRLLERLSGRGLVAVPLVLIVVIAVADVLSPPGVHLGALLVVAPALTAAFAGPRLTALIGLLAVIALVVTDALNGVLVTMNGHARLVALVGVSCLVVVARRRPGL
jgi:hypothetical protein